MSRLKSRQKFIPYGFKFHQPQSNWIAPPNASFETIVQALMAHRKGRPHMVKQHHLAVEHDAVADEVDEFNARICEQMGWLNYIQAPVGVAPPPKFRAPSLDEQKRLSAVAGRVKKIWAGVRTLNEWIDSGAPPVIAALSARRAATCAACPKNTEGDFTKWFTAPAAEAIRRQIERVADRKLATPSDAKLNICEVCLCPLKLKVHTPMEYINAHMPEAVLRDLERVPQCWIPDERSQ